MGQRTVCLSRGGMRAVEESFAVRLWRLSGGCWASCQPPHTARGPWWWPVLRNLEKRYVLSPRERANLGHVLRPDTRELLCAPQVKTQPGAGLALLARGLADSHTPAGSAVPE